jgi:serine/threonine protein kinase
MTTAQGNGHGLSRAPSNDPSLAAEDPRLLRAAQEYLSALNSGQKPDRREFLARHTEIADKLDEYLDGLDILHRAAPELRNPATSAAPPFGAETLSAAPLGDYRIVKEIGRGGMGIVYEAIQLSLGRRVALKVLPFAAALDSKHLQRFKNEAQAAAHFHHPNIVAVYAVGCERGVHFYAMQLIEGQTLALVVRQLRQLAGLQPAEHPGTSDGGRALATRLTLGMPAHAGDPLAERHPSQDETAAPRGAVGATVLTPTAAVAALSTQNAKRNSAFFRTVAELGLQAARALEHAHQMGIVHRDIKPANLLIDARGNIWLTDFGLAQFHADAGLTLTGDLVGTLRYMSPEQALGGRAVIDHRTDVYSLGITLYELLTLRPPFGGTDRQELLRQIADEEPQLPRDVDRAIPVELETIVLKAIAKSPADRYATAQDMADDLGRFLEDKPIRAKRPSLADKARKWARRHRHLVASAVAILLVAAAALLVVTLNIAREKAKTEAAYRLEREQRARAEQNFRLARGAVDSFALLGEGKRDDLPPSVELRKELLQMALLYYQAFIVEGQGDPSATADLKAAKARVANILNELAALEEYDRHAFPHRLLGEESVRRELQLSDDQAARSRELGFRMMTQRHEAASPNPAVALGERQRKFETLTKATEEGLAAILSPAQLQRLRQIALQVRGPRALADPDVMQTLGLTPAQRMTIRAVLDRVLPPKREPFPQSGRSPSPRAWAAIDSRAVTEALLAELTPEQKTKWFELIGAPFEGEVHFPPDGPPNHHGWPGHRGEPEPPEGFGRFARPDPRNGPRPSEHE